MSTSEACPFPRPKGTKLPPFQDHFHQGFTPLQDHWHKSNPLHKTITRRCPSPSRKMVSNTSTNNLNTSQRCGRHCYSVHPTTSSTKPRRVSPHHRNKWQHPLMSGNYKHHCHCTNTEMDATRSLSELISCLSPEITSIPPQQASHFATANPISSMDICLITDTTIDRHTSFHTTLQVITSQGSKPLHIRVNPGASCSSVPLIPLPQSLPQVLHQIRSPKEDSLQTYMDDMVSP